jgi:hypothetical protein
MTGGAALAAPVTTNATSNPRRNPLSGFTPLVVGNGKGFLQEETLVTRADQDWNVTNS